MELHVSGQRVRKLASKGRWEDQLRHLSKDQDEIINRFLRRLHQDFPQVVHKEKAFKRIEESGFQKRTKDKMRECWSREIATIFCREYLTNFCRRTPELVE